MNADIRYLKGVLDQLGQAVTVYRAERNKITSSAHARQEQVEAERLSEEARVNAAMSALTREYASEAERRAAIMERALISVNDELNNINEPHWHRMKHEYYEKARQDKAEDHGNQWQQEEQDLQQILADPIEKLRVEIDDHISAHADLADGHEISEDAVIDQLHLGQQHLCRDQDPPCDLAQNLWQA